MRLTIKDVLFLLVVLLFLFGCTIKQQVTEEEAFAQMDELSDEELNAVLTKDEALAGQAYKALPPGGAQKVSQVRQVAKPFTWSSCTDTDGGSNYNASGMVTVKYLYGGKPGEKLFSDECKGASLIEYYCKEKTYSTSTTACAFGCEKGACAVLKELQKPAVSQGEIFVGPLTGWRNVKTEYGAVGDGVADDTAALQTALNDLQQMNYLVLYIPSGTYRITSTLTLLQDNQGKPINIKIVGEDPATTKIIWDGPIDGSMFMYNPNYASLGRLTFDGKGKARIILEYGTKYSGWNEYFDLVLQDAGICLEAGKINAEGGHGALSDSKIIRTVFLRCDLAGVFVNDWNTLQLEIYDSLFKDNYIGISNFLFDSSLPGGAGNFHVYQSVFMNSTFTDTGIAAAGFFTIRDSISIGSNAFHLSTGTISPAAVTLQRNVILDPKGNITAWNAYYGGPSCMTMGQTRFAPICIGNAGTLVLLDNVFRVRNDYTGGIVHDSSTPTTFISIGNTYTVNDWFGETSSLLGQSKLRSIKDAVVERSTIADVIPKLPPTPAKISPPIFEIPAGADAFVIQKAIDDAVTFTGRRPTIHLPAGIYPINQTLVIPPNADILILGDVMLQGTFLEWVGKGNGPVLRIDGPSKATLREFSIRGKKGTYDGLVVTGIDQSRGRVRTHQVLTSRNNISFFLNKLKSVPIEFLSSAPDGSDSTGSIGYKVLGPGNGQQGAPILMMGEGGSLPEVMYDIENAYVLVRDAWTESRAELTPKYVRLRGDTTFTLHNFFQDHPRARHPDNVTILVDNIGGKASFIGGHFSASYLADPRVPEGVAIPDSFLDNGYPGFKSTPAVIVQGNNPMMKVAVIGSFGEGWTILQNKASVGEVGQIYLYTYNLDDIKLLDDSGKTDDAFLLEMFEQTRRYAPLSYIPTALGLSDIYLYRIFVEGANTGITFTPSYCGNKIREDAEQCDDGKISEFCRYGETSACEICLDCTGYAIGKTTYCGDNVCDLKYESSTSCPQDCGAACPSENLVSWWPGENNAQDLISKNHGELKGDTTYAAGVVGNSFSFDGNGDFVFVGDPFDGSLDFGSDDFTISFWGRSIGDGYFVAKGCASCTNNLGYSIDIAGGGIQPIYRIDGNPDGGSTILGFSTIADLTQWHHYAGVFDRDGSLAMYLDGQLKATNDISEQSGTTNNQASFLIGTLATYGGFLNGQIDELAVWRRTLSSQEIQAIYSAGSKGMCKH